MGRRVIYEAPPAVLIARSKSYEEVGNRLTAGGVADGTEAVLYGPTGQKVCTYQRISSSEIAVSSQEILLYNADATTFPDGAPASGAAIEREGGASAPTWGTVGAESTGGLILPVGELSLFFCGALHGFALTILARMVLSIGGSPADGDALAFGTYRDTPSEVIWGGAIDRIAGAYTRQYVLGTVGAPSLGGSTGAAYQEPLVDTDAGWCGRGVLATTPASNVGSTWAGFIRELDGGGANQQVIATTSSAITGNDAQTAWAYRSASNLGARLTRISLHAPRMG